VPGAGVNVTEQLADDVSMEVNVQLLKEVVEESR
jgi:hypothetical protein